MIIIPDSNIYEVIVEDIDIPFINMDNAILYKLHDDEFKKYFNLSEINSGITLYKNHFYYFNFNVVKMRHDSYRRYGYDFNSVAAYDIYKITNDTFYKIMNNEYKCIHWEIVFDSWINYPNYLICVGNETHHKIYSLDTPKKDGVLYVPKGRQPSDLKSGINIEDYLINHNNPYRSNNYFTNYFTLNKLAYRNLILDALIL